MPLKLVAVALAAAVLGFAAFWVLTVPQSVSADTLAAHAPDLGNGRTLFYAGGCASCHATPGQKDLTKLGGGRTLKTPFGIFYPPNISSDRADGIGGWSDVQFITAMTKGTGPGGRHLYPAFPYTSFQRITSSDLRDLFAFLKTLPAVKGRAPASELSFPYNLRRFIGLWKLLYLDGRPFQPDPDQSDVWNRGAYLVNGAGHCAECHSPRNFLGGIVKSERFAGGPNMTGKGWVPNITQQHLAKWSVKDIAYLLDTGMTLDGDSVGSSMSDVVENLSHLSADDRTAMATYIKSLPAVAGPEATEEAMTFPAGAAMKKSSAPGLPSMNLLKAVGFKLISALLFAAMSALVRGLGESIPVGQVVFFRGLFAVIPVLLIYAWRGELGVAVRTGRPLGQFGRASLSIGSIFTSFSALARLPLADYTAISFASPLITVALAALVLKERVRVYRWSAVVVGFTGVIVMLIPQFDPEHYAQAGAAAAAALGAVLALVSAFFNSATVIQTRRLTTSEATSSIVFYFSVAVAIAGALTLPFAWHTPTRAQVLMLIAIGTFGGVGHIFLTESYRYASASVIAPFDYSSMLWALLLGYWLFGELPGTLIYLGGTIVAGAGLFVIWRERQIGIVRAAGGFRRPEI